MFHRERPEKEYDALYKKYGLGTTLWSPLASGLLTGKYNDGIPKGSRLSNHGSIFQDVLHSFNTEEGNAKINKVKELSKIAEQELDCSTAQLALAWLARDPNTSTIILGASKPEQVIDNLKALDVIPKLTPEIMEKIENILGNKPEPPPTYGRPPLDKFGRQ